jgi:hypothetical protein
MRRDGDRVVDVVSELDQRSILTVALLMSLHRNDNYLTPEGVNLLLADVRLRSPEYYNPETILPVIRRFEEIGHLRVDWVGADEWVSMELLPSVGEGLLPPGHAFSGDCCR